MAVKTVKAFRGNTRRNLRTTIRVLTSLTTWQERHPNWPKELFSEAQLVVVDAVKARCEVALTETYPKPA